MAIDTASVPGEQQSVFAKAPTFPDSIGKLDVGAIYDRVKQGLSIPSALSDATRAGLTANSDIKTDVQKQAAIRSLIPAQTSEAAATAAAGTADAQNALRRANFLATQNPSVAQSIAAGNVLGQQTKVSRIYDTSDPKNPRLIDREETFIPDPKTGALTSVGTKTSEAFSPRDIQVFKEHTDANGNIVSTDGTYRQLDLSKPAFQVDKDGNISPILDKNGQPVNAALVAATGKAERGTYGGGGVAGIANMIGELETKLGPDDSTVKALKEALPNILNKIGSTAPSTPNQPKLGEAERLIARIDDLHKQAGEALSEGNSALAASLSSSAAEYGKRLDAVNAGTSHAKPARGAGLLNAPQTGTPAGTPGAVVPAGNPGTSAANPIPVATRAAYDALTPGSYYTDPNGVPGQKPQGAAAPGAVVQ